MTQLHSVASLDYGDGRTCICRICECNKHKCPGVKVPFDGDTTYRREYVPKRTEHESLRRERHRVVSTKAEPGHFKTTKQEAAELMAGLPVQPAESYKPRQGVMPSVPFDGVTTNRADYPGHVPDCRRVKPAVQAIPHLPGTYGTTKRSMDEQVDELAAQKALPKPPKSYKSNDTVQQQLPLEGVTSYTMEYPPKSVPTTRTRVQHTVRDLPEDRDFETVSSNTYKAPEVKVRHECPAAFVPQRPPSRDGHIKLSVYNIPSGDRMYT